jgi:HAD superfamily hydrolase (TIGR01490 family)
MKKYIVFFDLDKTLISVNSARLVVLFAQKKKLLSFRDILSGIYYSAAYKIGFLSTEDLMGIMTRWLKGADQNHLEQLFEDLGKYIVKNKIRRLAEEAVSFHRSRGAVNVILSASVRNICLPVAEYLKMDDIICTQMEIKNGVYSGTVTGGYCYGAEKLNRVAEYCGKHGYRMKDVWYYADSMADISVLNAVGHAVCVTPDARLKRYAKRMNWTIEYW